jgi:hypothetical protein
MRTRSETPGAEAAAGAAGTASAASTAWTAAVAAEEATAATSGAWAPKAGAAEAAAGAAKSTTHDQPPQRSSTQRPAPQLSAPASVGVVMECSITRQYTFIMAPNTVQELCITMPGRYTHAIHVFTPPWGYIHSSDSYTHGITIQAWASAQSTRCSSK